MSDGLNDNSSESEVAHIDQQNNERYQMLGTIRIRGRMFSKSFSVKYNEIMSYIMDFLRGYTNFPFSNISSN